jgi:hypothetical protein
MMVTFVNAIVVGAAAGLAHTTVREAATSNRVSRQRVVTLTTVVKFTLL